MTMRISIDIVPYGNEENVYQIFQFDIHNIGTVKDEGFGHQICSYKAELFSCNNDVQQKLLKSPPRTKEGEFIIKEHDRRDGSIELARKVTAAFCEEWG